MSSTIAASTRVSGRRLAYGALAVVLAAAAALIVFDRGAGVWQLFLFGFGPDVTLFFGAGPDLQKGQLHPRAVSAYNVLHSFVGPVAAAAVVVVLGLPGGYLVGAIAWGLHIAVDRAVGYGFRTRDGFQRA